LRTIGLENCGYDEIDTYCFLLKYGIENSEEEGKEMCRA
jgi:hypothetical protein